MDYKWQVDDWLIIIFENSNGYSWGGSSIGQLSTCRVLLEQPGVDPLRSGFGSQLRILSSLHVDGPSWPGHSGKAPRLAGPFQGGWGESCAIAIAIQPSGESKAIRMASQLVFVWIILWIILIVAPFPWSARGNWSASMAWHSASFSLDPPFQSCALESKHGHKRYSFNW